LAQFGSQSSEVNRVNCASPGVTDTGMAQRLMSTMSNTDVVTRGDLDTFRVGVPLGRVARSEEIADVVAFMQDVVVDGGGALGAQGAQAAGDNDRSPVS
jgi:2,3-dihydro-2,3-dihydroxybenzoate dehydrogenase